MMPARIKRLLRRLRRFAAASLGVGLSRLLGSRGREGFGILMYHRIAPGDGCPTWNVTPDRFRQQLRGLLDLGYHPYPLRQILAASREGRPLPRKAFVVTFDDGYENVYSRAWPVLRELNVPATVFVVTAWLDAAGPFPFDDWSEAGSGPPESWRPMTTEQARQFLRGGLVDLGCHTHSHEIYLGRPQAFAADVEASLAVLRDRFGVRQPTFAFPYGLAGADMMEVARQSGLSCALTTRAAIIRPGSDPFGWGRFAVEQGDTAATIAAQLDGWCSLARQTWRRGERRTLSSLRPLPRRAVPRADSCPHR